jgi:hypothetical protein
MIGKMPSATQSTQDRVIDASIAKEAVQRFAAEKPFG